MKSDEGETNLSLLGAMIMIEYLKWYYHTHGKKKEKYMRLKRKEKNYLFIANLMVVLSMQKFHKINKDSIQQI